MCLLEKVFCLLVVVKLPGEITALISFLSFEPTCEGVPYIFNNNMMNGE